MKKYTLLRKQPYSAIIDWIHLMVKTGEESIEVTFESGGRKTIFVRRDYVKGCGHDVAEKLGVLDEYRRLNNI
jgi:hypothetical protein